MLSAGAACEWAVPVFTAEQHGRLLECVREIAGPLAELMGPTVEELYLLMRRATPKHLHGQIKGVFGAELNSIIAMICDELERRELLEKPGGDCFAGQVILTIE